MPNLPSATKCRVHAHPVSAGRDQAASQQQGHEAPPSIIPVGQEPRRQLFAEQTPPTGSSGRGVAASESIATKKPQGKARGGLRSPEKLFRVKDRLLKLRIFTMETMGALRRAEITVWLAIFNCENRLDHWLRNLAEKYRLAVLEFVRRDFVAGSVVHIRSFGDSLPRGKGHGGFNMRIDNFPETWSYSDDCRRYHKCSRHNDDAQPHPPGDHSHNSSTVVLGSG